MAASPSSLARWPRWPCRLLAHGRCSSLPCPCSSPCWKVRPRAARTAPRLALRPGYFGVAFHWIGFAFLVDAETYLWMMPFMVGGLAGGMAIYWGSRRSPRGWPPAWIEPGHRLRCRHRGGGMAPRPSLHGISLGRAGPRGRGDGTCGPGGRGHRHDGLTLLILLLAGLPLVLLSPGLRRERWLALALLALLPAGWGFGAWHLSSPKLPDTELSVRIVQPNIPQSDKWRSENARAIFDTLQQLSLAPTADRPAGLPASTT